MNASNLYSFFISVLLIIGLGSCKQDPKVINEDTVHIHIKEDPPKLNPIQHPNPVARQLYQYIFSQSAGFDPVSLQLTPVLVKEVPEGQILEEGEYAGGVRFDMEFREEAKWDNGSPVTGEDYLFTVKAILHPKVSASAYRSYLGKVIDVIVDKDNPKKFSVIFEDYLLAKETAVTIEVYPREMYDPENRLSAITIPQLKQGETTLQMIEGDSSLTAFANEFNSIKYSREVVSGAGPYYLKEWNTGQNIVIERKEDFWGKDLDGAYFTANPKTIVFHIIPDESTALTQMKNGNLDLITRVDPSDFDELRKDPVYKDKFNFLTPQLPKYYYIAINNAKPALNDVQVRNALSRLVDVNNLIAEMEYGMATPTIGPIPPTSSYYNRDIEPVKYSTEEAASLLDAAGWTDTDNDGIRDKIVRGQKEQLEFNIYASPSELGKKVAVSFQEAAEKANVKINVFQKPFKVITADHIRKGDWDFVAVATTLDITLYDPYQKWHSDNIRPVGNSNFFSYLNEESDDVIEAIRTEHDTEKRNALYLKFQEIVYKDQPVIFLYSPTEKILLSKKWKGESTSRRPGYMANTFEPADIPVLSSN